MIEIEKGIPVPINNRNGVYPWKTMEVGDSFVIRGKVHASNHRLVSTANRNFEGRRYVSRLTEDGGTRVWRVS